MNDIVIPGSQPWTASQKITFRFFFLFLSLEVLGGSLILFKRTRVAGLLIIVPILLNIILINYTYVIGIQVTSFYLLLITLFLLAPYTPPILNFFFRKQPATLAQSSFVPGKNIKILLLRVFAILIVSVSFILETKTAIGRWLKDRSTERSRQHSLVKHFVVNNDMLKLIENDTTCWRMWSERTAKGKRYVTITTMKPGAEKTYTIDRDSTQCSLVLHPSGQADTTPVYLTYKLLSKTAWCLEGTMNGQTIHAGMERINPDTTLLLLKTRRNLVTLDGD